MVFVFYVYGHTSLQLNIFEIKFAEAFSEPCQASEVRDFSEIS